MFVVLKLILAHLIADFILQFEELYQLKVRSFWGQLLHVLIHGTVSLLLLVPYWDVPQLWLFVLWLILVHLAQDLLKYSATKKVPAKTFVYFMFDQVCHLLVIGTVLFFPFSQEVRGFPSSAFLDTLYRQNFWTVGAIFFITLTFAGSYILNAFVKSYVKDKPPVYLITSPEITHAIIERSLVAGILFTMVSPWAVLAIPCVGILRLPFKNLRDLTAFLLSVNYAVIVTLLFQKVL